MMTDSAHPARTLTLVAALLAVTVLLAACAPVVDSSEEDAVRAVVTRYNRVLAEGYRSMDMSRMREVAEELQAEDEYVHMSALAEGGVRLLPVLTDRRFVKVTVEATSAKVETAERWDYTHEDRVSRDVVLIQRDLRYELAWDLSKHEDGRWYVTDVRSVSATAPVPAARLATPTAGLGLP